MIQFGINMTLGIIEEQFYRNMMRQDVSRIYGQCIDCRIAKYHLFHQGLYIPQPNPQSLWLDIIMDFVLGLPRKKKVDITFLLWLINFIS